MSDGVAVLKDRIARFRLLATFGEDAAPLVTQAVKADMRRQLEAGVTPDGKPWTPRKSDGGRPLARAAEEVTVGAVGNVIIVRIKARHYVLHHFGYSRGDVERQLIPRDKIPESMLRAIREALEERFQQIMGVAA